MARHLRVQFEGAIYHVTVRGNGRADIFTDDSERNRLLERLAERVEIYNIRLYQFVLMTNHFHLVFETPSANLCRFMQSLLTSYSVYFNLRHGRHGHVTEGRYKAKLVEGDRYLLSLTRYVHLNPVCTKQTMKLPVQERVRLLRGYRWSSYRSYIGAVERLEFVEYDPMLAQMCRKRKDRAGRYMRFVESGLAATDEAFVQALHESPRSIGSARFHAWVDDQYQALLDQQAIPGDTVFRRMAAAVPSEEIIAAVAEAFGVRREDVLRRQRDTPIRGVAATLLCQYGGFTQREAAETLGLHTGAAVGYQIRKLRSQRCCSKELDSLVSRLHRDLKNSQHVSP